MKRRKSRVLIALLMLTVTCIVLIAFSACSKSPKALPAPENVAVERRVLVWDSVENATGYLVYINGVEYQTAECRLDIHELTVEGGVFDIDVIASGDQKKYLDSLGMRITVTLDAPPESGTDELGFAYTFCEDVVGYEVSAGTADLTGTVVIPDYFCDYPVKQLATYALNPYWPAYLSSTMGSYKDYYPGSNKGVNSVTTAVILPAHLERVEQWAFYKVVNLTEIVIPDSVTYMGPSTFANCRNLTSAVLPKNLTVIPGSCFENCPLYEITIPETVVEIQTGAFAYYYEVASSPEQHRSSLPSSVTIPAGVQVIGAEAFAGQRNLETIIFEDSTNLKSVGYDVFAKTAWYEAQPEGILYLDTLLYGCKGYFADETIHIAAPTTLIAEEAFGAFGTIHPNVKKIVITAPLKEIPKNVFTSCDFVTEVVLPDGLEIIGESAFASCSALKSINFPDTVTYIGSNAFWGTGFENFTVPKNVTTFVYNMVGGPSLVELIIPKTVTNIEKGIFNSGTLTSVVFEASLESLTRFPFNNCNALTHFYFGGTRAEFEVLIKDAPAAQKQLFTDEIMYYYSETEPSEAGNYWHYVDGEATPWFE